MSAHGREAVDDYSKEMGAPAPIERGARRLPGALGALGAGLGLAGAAMAVVATFSTVIKIVVLTVEQEHYSGFDRYGPALLVLAAFAVVMVAGGWRGARPAMAALALAGIGVLVVVALIDIPHINDEGVWPQADVYEDAQASAGIGFYFETAAGVLMMLGGAMMLLFSPAAHRRRAGADDPRATPRSPRQPHRRRPRGRSNPSHGRIR